MRKNKLNNKKIKNLVGEITETFRRDSGINFIDASNLPMRDEILQILDLLFEVLFPGYTGKRTVTKSKCQLHRRRYPLPALYRTFRPDRTGLSISMQNRKM